MTPQAKAITMTNWLGYALGAAVLYGLHQVFTKLASAHASDGLGGFIVEASATVTIAAYLLYLRAGSHWNQYATPRGVAYSVATGACVGAGTVFFFQMFQRGSPLSAVPVVLAAGSAIMVVAGLVVFHEAMSWKHLLGIALSMMAILLLKGD